MNYDEKLQELICQQAKMEEQIKAALKRIDEQKALTESVQKLAISVELLASAQKTTEIKVDNLTNDVNDIKLKPAKKWETVVAAIITGALGCLIGYVMTRMGIA